MIWVNDYDTSNEPSITRKSSSSSITNLMETKNPILLMITSLSSLSTGLVVLCTGLFGLVNKKFIIIEYELRADTKLKLIPIIVLNILNFLISLYQIYFYYALKNQSDPDLMKLSFSFFTWKYPIMQAFIGVLYIIGSFMRHSFAFITLKVFDLILIIILLTPLYKSIKEKRCLNTLSTIGLSFYFSIVLSMISFFLYQNGIDLILLMINQSKKEALLFYKPIISDMIQLLTGLSLLAYFKDIIYLMTSCLFFFLTSLLLSIIGHIEKKTYVLGGIFFITLSIILWFYFQRRYLKRNGNQRESIDPCITVADNDNDEEE